MDRSLELLIKYDKGIDLNDDEIKSSLEGSALLKKLTCSIPSDPYAMVWRIIGLSEIPFTHKLDYTNSLKDSILNKMGTSAGFSITGKKADLLPCYNAMLIKAFCKLGFYESDIVENGINWILRYQSFHRNFVTDWDMHGIHRHGGCLRSTPCYIGVVKSVFALIEYNKYKPEEKIQGKINEGLEYILDHNVYQRKSDSAPITKHILDLCFPESYNVTILELLSLLFIAGKLNDDRVQNSIAIIHQKMNAARKWGVDYAYSGNGYISFDGKSRNADWISYKLKQILMNVKKLSKESY